MKITKENGAGLRKKIKINHHAMVNILRHLYLFPRRLFFSCVYVYAWICIGRFCPIGFNQGQIESIWVIIASAVSMDGPFPIIGP